MDQWTVISRIKNEIPDKWTEIVKCLELLRNSICDTHNIISAELHELVNQQEYVKISDYTKAAELIGKLIERIDKIMAVIDVDINELPHQPIFQKELIDTAQFDKYTVGNDNSWPLTADFTNKKPYGFRINNLSVVRVSSWRQMLVRVCQYLMAIDKQKFLNFRNDKELNGIKRQYFSTNYHSMIAPKKIAENFYVETNHSSNTIRDLIIKLLKEYEFNPENFYVYLRLN